MPHESTVAHEQSFVADTPMFSRSRQLSMLDGVTSTDSILSENKTPVIQPMNNVVPKVSHTQN